MDPDYTGSVHMLLLNLSSQNHAIEANHHIAQLILEKVAYPIPCEVPQMLPTECGAKEERNLISPSHPTNHDNEIVK